MDRSLFRSSRFSRDSSPLLPQHEHSRSSSYPLSDLDPRPYTDGPASTSSQPRSPVRSQPSQVSTSPHSTRSARDSNSPRRPRVQFSHPPPPIASVLLSPSQPRSLTPSRHATSLAVPNVNNPLSGLTRREKALQAELQTLLDAQSAGLVQGGGQPAGGDGDTNSEASTVTGRDRSRDGSSSRSDVNGRVVPVRQPKSKPLSLRGARRGILGMMEELGVVKEAEALILKGERKRLEETMRRVKAWEKKLKGFEETVRKITESGLGREETELKAEKTTAAEEIRELEDRLLELRARDRVLGLRIRELGNKREAELSSFTEGKREVEREVREWLRRPSLQDVTSMVAGLLSSGAGAASEDGHSYKSNPSEEDVGGDTIPFLALPTQRRTLPLANSFLASSLSTINRALDSVSHEHAALLSGGELWASTVTLVSDFESDLRKQLKEDATQGKELGIEDLKRQLGKMESVIGNLERNEGKAMGEGWNLLICAIGAELEAFREGEGMLKGVLGTLDPGQDQERILELGADRDMDADAEREDSFLTAPLDLERESLEGSLEGRRDTLGELHTGHGEEREQDNTPKVELEGLQDLSLSQRSAIKRGKGKADESQRYRDASPARSESDDDGPPQTLLVGLEEDRDGDEML